MANNKNITFDQLQASMNKVKKAIDDSVYTHPDTSGYKHIPSGGSSGQILRWYADGTAQWGSDNNTDTNVTNTLATTTKAYVTGTTSPTTNTGTQVFDTGVYLDTAAGRLVATTFKGELNGNASTATKLAAPKTISLNGDVTGSVGFDGSGNVTLDTYRRHCCVGQTSSTTTNPYYKFASIRLSETYSDREIVFKVSTGYSNNEASGILRAHVRTNSSSIIESANFYWEYANKGIEDSKFIMAYSTGSNPIIELWAICDVGYMMYHFEVLQEHERGGTWSSRWTLYNTCQAGSASSITSGYTQIPSSFLQLNNNEFDSLNISGELSTDILNVNVINNPKYPPTLDSTIDIPVNYNSGSDDYTLDEVLASIDESNQTGSTDAIKKFRTVNTALSQLPRFLNGMTARIHMETDTSENININYFTAGRVFIYLGGKTINGYVKAFGDEAPIYLYGGTVDNTSTTGYIHAYKALSFNNRNTTVGADTCRYFGLYNINVYGADNTANSGNVCCVMAQGGGTVYCTNIAISSCDIGFRANNTSQIQMNSSSGMASIYGFEAYTGGKVSFANNKQAGGVTASTHKANGGQIWIDSATFESGSATVGDKNASAPSTTATATYKSTLGDTYRSSIYNNWKKDSTCRQGDWGYGDCTGVWFFGTQFSELKGKTINKVTITITRQSGGSSASVEHKLWMHNHTTRPSGAPTLTSGWSQTFSLAIGNSTTITITNSTVLNAIKAGTCKGFAIRHTYDSSHYSVCSGSATVKITYTE